MNEIEMGPKDYLLVLKRRKGSLIWTALVIFVVAAVVALMLPASYKSAATILIENQEIPNDFVMTTITTYAEQQLQETYQRTMSSTKLLEIIDQLGLYQDLKEKLTTEEIVEEMQEDIKLDLISADVMDPRTGRPASTTIAFTLTYESEGGPEKVFKTANTLTTLFLEENLKEREKQATGTFTFLDDEAKKVKVDLVRLEEGLKVFKEQHADSLPELLQVNLQGLQRIELKTDSLRGNLQSLQENEGFLLTQLASLPETDTGASGKSRLVELRVQLAYLTTNYSDEYPDVIKTKAEIAELEKILNSGTAADGEASSPTQPDNPAYITLAAQLSSTRSKITSVTQEMADLGKKEEDYQQRVENCTKLDGEYKTLVNERNNTELKYNDLTRKVMEARVSQGLEKEQKGGRFTLIDPARLPEKPSKPNRLAIALIGMVLGIGGGFGMLALREFMDESVRSADVLALATSFPVLGSVPEIVTVRDRRLKMVKRWSTFLLTVAVIVAGIAAFHFLVMDLDIFWAKVVRKIDLYL